ADTLGGRERMQLLIGDREAHLGSFRLLLVRLCVAARRWARRERCYQPPAGEGQGERRAGEGSSHRCLPAAQRLRNRGAGRRRPADYDRLISSSSNELGEGGRVMAHRGYDCPLIGFMSA